MKKATTILTNTAFDVLQMPDGSKAFGSKWEPPSTFICDVTRDYQSDLMNNTMTSEELELQWRRHDFIHAQRTSKEPPQPCA